MFHNQMLEKTYKMRQINGLQLVYVLPLVEKLETQTLKSKNVLTLKLKYANENLQAFKKFFSYSVIGRIFYR